MHQIRLVDLFLVTCPRVGFGDSVQKHFGNLCTFRTVQRCSNVEGIKPFNLQKGRKNPACWR